MPTPSAPPSIVTFATAAPSATITRPSDTTTYAAGDEVSNSTSAPTIQSFTVGARLGGSGTIKGVQLVTSAVPALAGSFELWLFNSTNTPNNDNSAFSPSDAEALTLVAVVPLSYSYDTANNRYYSSGDIARPFVCASTDTKLYGRVVVRNAYIPVSAETLAITIYVDQDV